MKSPNGIEVAYNVQIATSEKHKLIIDFEAVNTPADQVLLSHMAIKAKETLKLEKVEVLADTGYYSGQEIKKCIDNNIIPYIPKPTVSSSGLVQEFSKENFLYKREDNIYICPNKQLLRYRASYIDQKGMDIIKYECKTCHKCPDKNKCTTNKTGRTITRWKHEDLMENMQQRVKKNPQLMRKRKAQVEHPFGTIKRAFGYGYQLLRGLDKVNAEFSLTFLAYNIKRVMNILNNNKLIKAMS